MMADHNPNQMSNPDYKKILNNMIAKTYIPFRLVLWKRQVALTKNYHSEIINV